MQKIENLEPDSIVITGDIVDSHHMDINIAIQFVEKYVSRGLGNSIIPVRLFNDPEIVCIDLKKQK